MISDKAWLEAMKIVPWETDAPAAGQQPSEPDAGEGWYAVSVAVDECGVAHLAGSDLHRILATNSALGVAAENWCRRAQKAERLVKVAAYLAMGCVAGVLCALIYVVSR